MATVLEASQAQHVEVVVVARAVVREDTQLLRHTSLGVAGVAEGSSISASVVVVILAFDHTFNAKKDAAMLTVGLGIEGFVVLWKHQQGLRVLPAVVAVDAEPQQLPHELEEGVAAAVAHEDLRLELWQDGEALATNSVEADAGDAAVLAITLALGVQLLEEGLDIGVDDQLAHEGVMPVLEAHEDLVPRVLL